MFFYQLAASSCAHIMLEYLSCCLHICSWQIRTWQVHACSLPGDNTEKRLLVEIVTNCQLLRGLTRVFHFDLFLASTVPRTSQDPISEHLHLIRALVDLVRAQTYRRALSWNNEIFRVCPLRGGYVCVLGLFVAGCND